MVGLEGEMFTKAENLSHGQTQWLELAMLLMQDCQVILMDEPTAGMTVQETNQTAALFRELQGDHTMIVVEHDMEFVRKIARTVSVLHQGSLLAEGTMDEVQNNPDVIEVYLGKDAGAFGAEG